jgi:2-polyprenyl-3-methyl-5-hydroxy-6-metoxy-1,4-benzoquinol methylase
MKCRHCKSDLTMSFIDLGSAPPSNAYLTVKSLHASERWFPLRILVCINCWLVQTEDFAGASELFNNDYAYFSSFSTTWLDHCKVYVEEMIDRFKFNETSHIVEVAANDGYLLQYVKEHGIPCLGIEPTSSTATAARKKGIFIIEDFFGMHLAHELASQGKQADLMIANNVLAHVPDINDFIKGFALLLKPTGVATFEFPHLLKLVAENQFDTIYHEHFSYLSLHVVKRIFEQNGLNVFDVVEIPTHGGSLRVFAQRSDARIHVTTPNVTSLIDKEVTTGMMTIDYYKGFQTKAEKVKNDLLAFLLEAKISGKKVVAYGAAAKGNTLLNYAGVRGDLLSYVVDRSPAKQGKFLPGSRIPVIDEQFIHDNKPDYIIILPWNLREEVVTQLSYIREWNGKFVTAVPKLEII